jgi:MFS family permease
MEVNGSELDVDFEVTSVPVTLVGRIRGNREVVLVAMCVVQFFAASCVVVFGVLPGVVSVLASSPVQASFLVASPVVTTVVLPVPVTFIARKFGGKTITVVLCVISAIALAIAAAVVLWAPLGPRLYPLFVVLGLGAGCGSVTFNSAIVQCSWWFPLQRQGTIAGLLLFFWILCVWRIRVTNGCGNFELRLAVIVVLMCVVCGNACCYFCFRRSVHSN